MAGLPDRREASEALRLCLERMRATPWIACFHGVEPPGIVPLDGDPRIGWLRDHPRWRHMLAPTRFARFWLREVWMFQLLTAVELRSVALNETPAPVTLTELAAAAGLSVAKTQEALEAAVATGDIIKLRAVEDGRLLVLDLAPSFEATLEQRHRDYFGMMAGFTGRRDASGELSPPAWRAMRRVLLHTNLTATGPSRAVGSGAIRRSFLYLMQDLLVDGPQPARGFTRQAAERLGVTAVTVRNTLTLARVHGWIEPGALLEPTRMARRRFGFAHATLEARWNALLDLTELLVAEPRLAALLGQLGDQPAAPPALAVQAASGMRRARRSRVAM